MQSKILGVAMGRLKLILASLVLVVCFTHAMAQSLGGKVVDSSGKPIEGAECFLNPSGKAAFTSKDGTFKLSVESGSYQLIVFKKGFASLEMVVDVNGSPQVEITLQKLQHELREFNVNGSRNVAFGVGRLRSVDGMAIYAAKKNEVVIIDSLLGNKATNNPRQLFAKVPGLTIWESDGAGLQLGIGARGLSPNRTSNFNTRQNGYDIAADALGYPESYYTPPAEALQRIEVVRGAASLQYGPQFGGMINFVLKNPSPRKIAVESRQTAGSFGLFNSFNRISGTTGNWSYQGYYQYKRGDGWRPNSGFELHNGYAELNYAVQDKWRVSAAYTYMKYVAQQPGGLTDRMFEQDNQQSVRSRNWFQVNWNLFALNGSYSFSKKTKLNTRFFALLANRDALGNLERINVADFGQERTLITSDFQNIGNETRLLHHYRLLGNPSTFLTGIRAYLGNTHTLQGNASTGSGPDFNYVSDGEVENSDYTFPNKNYSWFAENVFRLSPKLTFTPGVRFESIRTNADGWYKQRIFNFAGDLVSETKYNDDRNLERSFFLAGVGMGYKPILNMEVYANFSQNYRAVTFSDMQIDNPNFIINPDLKDETGFNIDLGFRGNLNDKLSFDMSLFYLSYRDKIGLLNVANEPPLFLDQRYRTNIGNSRTWGIEAFGELAVLKTLGVKTNHGLNYFANIAYTDAVYQDVSDESINGNQVELVPEWNVKTGLAYRYKNIKISYQMAYVSEQYTDATNATFVSTAVSGLIPAYYVQDLSVSFHYKWFTVETGVNNLANRAYFTRRAVGYPGPGIIPADARNLYLTLAVTF